MRAKNVSLPISHLSLTAFCLLLTASRLSLLASTPLLIYQSTPFTS